MSPSVYLFACFYVYMYIYIYVCINRLFHAKHHYPPAAFVVSLIGGGRGWGSYARCEKNHDFFLQICGFYGQMTNCWPFNRGGRGV